MTAMFHFGIRWSNVFDNMDLEILNFGKSFRAYGTFESENGEQDFKTRIFQKNTLSFKM